MSATMEAGDESFVLSNPRLIAFTGRAGSGKSTASEYLARNFGYKRTRFAGPLKAMIRALYATAGLSEREIERRVEGDLKETPDPLLQGKTPRHAMQTLGTEWRDMIGRDLWTALWRESVASGYCVVEDCRFDHEANAIKELGGIIVHINRGEASEPSHVSERGLSIEPDWVIDNSGDLSALHVEIGRMLYVLGR